MKCECADNSHIYEDANPDKMEWNWFTTIKLSDGQLNGLYYAVDIAPIVALTVILAITWNINLIIKRKNIKEGM